MSDEHQKYLTGLALFTLASKQMRLVEIAEAHMSEILGVEEGSHFSDEIYTIGGGDFDIAWKKVYGDIPLPASMKGESQ